MLGWLKSIYDNLTTVDTVVDTNQDLLDSTTATPNAYRREYGRRQVKEVSVTSAANAGADTTLATVTTQGCIIDSIIVHADAAQTADMTSATVVGGAAGVIEFIAAADLQQEDVDAENKQAAYTGIIGLPATSTIVMVHTGTGATALNLTVWITYWAAVDGGYLA